MRKGTQGKAIHIFSRKDNGRSILSSAIHNYILLLSIHQKNIPGHCVWIWRNTNISGVSRFKYLKRLLYVNHTNFILIYKSRRIPIHIQVKPNSFKGCYIRLEKKWSLSLNPQLDTWRLQNQILSRKPFCMHLGFLITWFLKSWCSSLAWKQRWWTLQMLHESHLMLK